MSVAGICECGHPSGEHGRKRCTAPDSYGIRCECDGFILDRSDEDDEDDEPESDANDFIQPRQVAQLEEAIHGRVCTDYYADRDRRG